MRRSRFALMLCVLALTFIPLPFARQSARAETILDENSSWRRCCRFNVSRYSPALIKSEGRQVLGQAGLQRLQRDVERWHTFRNVPIKGNDWTEDAVMGMPGSRGFNPAPTPPMPADWMKAGFDDGDWVQLGHPFQGGPSFTGAVMNLGQYSEDVDLRLQQSCYRGRFVVTDPAKAGTLTLRVVYTGGVCVYLNGAEIARANLPAGPLADDAAGDDYPAAAYQPRGEKLRDRTLGPVKLPANLLHKGVNVLAIDLRASRFHPIVATAPIQPNWGGPQRPFPHVRLSQLELTAAGAGVASGTKRPAGVQVWVANLHRRTLDTDFLPPGEDPGKVELIGAKDGAFAAQLVVGTDKPLTGLKVTASALAQTDGGGAIAAEAFTVQYPVPYLQEKFTAAELGDERGLNAKFPDQQQLALWESRKGAKGPYLFDHLRTAPPEGIPANSAQPVWLSLAVPADAPAGSYRGTVTLSASGCAPVSVPVELELVDWRLPKPWEFKTFVGCEENPYAVARQYGVKLWSDEHFKLIEASLKQLARIGNTWVNVPVLADSEFGNADDSMVVWVRKRDGSWEFDTTVLDRYLDLVTKTCALPRVVNFVVMHGMSDRNNPPTPPEVIARDERTGRTGRMAMDGRGVSANEKRDRWEAFATAMVEHMRRMRLEKSMWWGYPLENEDDPQLKVILAKAAPNVYWIAGPHEMMANGTFVKDEKYYRLIADIRYQGRWPSFRDDMGWKSKTLHLANPRVGGTAQALHTTSLPFAWRALADRCIALGRGGFTRVGADEWAATHFDGMEVPRWLTGFPVLFVLWPGPAGAEPSIRFEAMLEGIQESEARIFIEQAIDAGKLSAPLANRAKKMLDANFEETTFMQGNSILYSLDEYDYRWQARSRNVYRMAAEIAKEMKP